MRWVQTKFYSGYKIKIKSLRFECGKKDCVEDEKRFLINSTGMFKEKTNYMTQTGYRSHPHVLE